MFFLAGRQCCTYKHTCRCLPHRALLLCYPMDYIGIFHVCHHTLSGARSEQTSDKIFGILDTPLVPNSRNLPSFGQNLANPHLSSADVI